MGDLLELLLDSCITSVAASMQLFCIVLVGVLSASAGLFRAPQRNALAKMQFAVFGPCFVMGLSPVYESWSHIAAGSAAIVAVLAHILIMAVVGAVAARGLGLDAVRARLFMLCMAFPNGGGLPYVLFAPLCKMWAPLRADPGALQRVYGYIILYVGAFNLAFFSFGRYHIDAARAMLANPAEGGYAVVSGIEVTATSPVRDPEALEEALGDAVADAPAGDPKAQPRQSEMLARPDGGLARSLFRKLTRDPILLALAVSVFVGTSPASRALFGRGGDGATGAWRSLSWLGGATVTIGGASVPSSTLLLGGALHESYERSRKDGGSKPTRSTFAAAIVLRLVLQPLCLIPLTHFLVTRCMPPDSDPALRLLLYVWCGVPSSQSLVALVEKELGPIEASRLSALYVPQYAAAVVTVPLVVTASILLIGDGPPAPGPPG